MGMVFNSNINSFLAEAQYAIRHLFYNQIRLAVTLAVYIVGKVSGGHINPAVTVAESVMGNFKWIEVPLYIIAQVFIFKNRTNIPY